MPTQIPPLLPTPKSRLTLEEFFYPLGNPTIQAYYHFTVTPLTPFAALCTRPLDGPMNMEAVNHANAADPDVNAEPVQVGISGLLRRSFVLPSHGTDPSGRWIFVSIGARSGWERRDTFEQVHVDAGAGAQGKGEGENKTSHQVPVNQCRLMLHSSLLVPVPYMVLVLCCIHSFIELQYRMMSPHL